MLKYSTRAVAGRNVGGYGPGGRLQHSRDNASYVPKSVGSTQDPTDARRNLIQSSDLAFLMEAHDALSASKAWFADPCASSPAPDVSFVRYRVTYVAN